MRTDLAEARRLLHRARRVTVLTGAGVSAESGVPTFRGEQGLWKSYRPEDLAKVEAFEANPELVWEWYRWRQSVVAGCEPNSAHRALVELERRSSSFTLLTQNIDGLHQKAGSLNVEELHGSLWRARCTREGKSRDFTGQLKCECGAWLRPHVIWFGEPLDSMMVALSFHAAERSEAFLVVGTSGLVAPANRLPRVAADYGAIVIEINTEPTALSSAADFFLAGPAGELLLRLVARDS